MNNNSLTPIIETLEDLYSKFNFKVFNGELETPVITLSPNSKRGSGAILGWFTTWRSWGTDKDNRPDGGSSTDSGGYYEINVCAEYLTRPMNEIAGTLLHEMVHLYNQQRGVQDCSRSGYYHNKSFKEAAESHGLIVTKSGSHGYSQTCLNYEMSEYVASLNIPDFKLYRRSYSSGILASPDNMAIYTCPSCNQTVLADRTAKIDLICGKCHRKLVSLD